ncbi:hypothetical protein [Pseudomonas sp.]|uniref:hypothetical protein n=1 Tax=Pseudomonas sp. TaxID=306 RepID=UPI00258548E3|nr:hypothetical protein [Pseudomonas sp.]
MTAKHNRPRAVMPKACPKKAKPSRVVAIHEAGHALAYWWNGQGIYSATARSKVEILAGPYIDRKGRESNPGGIVEASSFIPAPSLALEYGHGMPAELLPELVARDLLHAYSGPVAEAIHRRTGLEWVLWDGGYSDWQHAGDLLALLPEADQPEAGRLAIARCRELVRRYWPAVEALADLLQARGHVEGEDVEGLLCAVTGEAPKWRGKPLAHLDKRGARHA